MSLFPLGSLLVYAGQVMLRPVSWWMNVGGTSDPGPARGNFQSFCINTLENHFLCGCQAGRIWAQLPKWGACLRIKPTQRYESKEITDLLRSLTENLHPSSHEASGVFSYKSQGIPCFPPLVWVSFHHLQLKKVWLITEVKGKSNPLLI